MPCTDHKGNGVLGGGVLGGGGGPRLPLAGKLLGKRSAGEGGAVLSELHPSAAQAPRGYPQPQKPQLQQTESQEQRDADEAAAVKQKRDQERVMRRELMIPDDAPTDVAALEALGVPAGLVGELSRCEARFGPRGGISDARRLLRAIRFGHLLPGTALEAYLVPLDSFW